MFISGSLSSLNDIGKHFVYHEVGVHTMNVNLILDLSPIVKALFMDFFRIHLNPPSKIISHSFSLRRLGSKLVKQVDLKMIFFKPSFNTRIYEVLAVWREMQGARSKHVRIFYNSLIHESKVVIMVDKDPKIFEEALAPIFLEDSIVSSTMVLMYVLSCLCE